MSYRPGSVVVLRGERVKASRLPMWLILLGILLLTLFFGRMLQQALHNDQLGFERDLRFQGIRNIWLISGYHGEVTTPHFIGFLG